MGDWTILEFNWIFNFLIHFLNTIFILKEKSVVLFIKADQFSTQNENYEQTFLKFFLLFISFEKSSNTMMQCTRIHTHINIYLSYSQNNNMKYQRKKKRNRKMFGKFVKKNCQKLNFHILELKIIHKWWDLYGFNHHFYELCMQHITLKRFPLTNCLTLDDRLATETTTRKKIAANWKLLNSFLFFFGYSFEDSKNIFTHFLLLLFFPCISYVSHFFSLSFTHSLCSFQYCWQWRKERNKKKK